MQPVVRTLSCLLALALVWAAAISHPAIADEKLLVVGGWDYGEAVFARAASELGMSASFVATEETGNVTLAELQAVDVVFLLNLKPDGAVALQQRLAEATRAKPALQVLALDQRASQADVEKAGLLVRDPEVRAYWRFNGFENTKRLLQYIRVKYLGGEGKIQPPIAVPDHGLYHPDAADYFSEVSAYTQWAKEHGHYQDEHPRVALLVQQSFLITGDTKVYEALLGALEKKKINAVVIFGRDPDKQQALLDAWSPELLIDDAHASPSLLNNAAERDIPILKSVELLRSTIDEWEASPQGMLPADVGLHFLSQEIYGIIDPVVVAGLKANVGGYKLHEPIAERVDRMAERVAAWLKLRHTPSDQKKIAIIYYNTYLSKADVARGSATGAFLDAPESLFRLLTELKQQGYQFSKFPKDKEELLEWMRTSGRNVGQWAEGDLASIVREGTPVLIEPERYQTWFGALNDANRQSVVSAFGPPPGSQMVWSEEGEGGESSEPSAAKKRIVLPRIDLGNVVLMPQPARGPENDVKLLHAKDVPPPHQYLAFYWWLQHDFGADAVIHFGTHGTEFLLPGKANGLSQNCFGDICLGNMPNIYPWIIDNLAEAVQAKRRAYAVTVDHLTPPLESAGLSVELQNLHSDIEKFLTLEEGLLKNKYRKSISDAAREHALSDVANELSDKEIEQVEMQLHAIESSVTAMKLHVLGAEPDSKHLIPFLASMLGHACLDQLATVLPVPPDIAGEPEHVRLSMRPLLETIVRQMIEEDLSAAEALQLAGAEPASDATQAVAQSLENVRDYRAAFSQTEREITNILRALDGKFISPGPGADPVRNPGALPTGRNIYSMNPEEVPTKQAWDVGVQLVDQLLAEKPDLKKVAFDMNAFETMRDYGVTESQALYLMGVRPVWDHNNLAVDVEIIPRDELKRSRRDVFISISGTMRDNFASRVKLLDKAVRLISELDEPDNLVRSGTEAMRKELEQRGFSPERVAVLAPARIFGAKPGEYGTRILYLVPKTGSWDDRSEIADVYKNNMSYVFTGDLWGESVPGLYEDAMKNTELVLRTWTSNMTGPLTNHHVYEYAGGLSLAIEQSTGRQPELMLNDVRGAPKVRNFNEVLTTEAHATMFNPKWLRGMMENDYSGAGMMAEVVRNTAGWQATRAGSVSNAMWNEIHEVYVLDKHGLQLRQFMERANPHAFQEIAAVLLEAHRKGDWQASEQVVRDLAREYAQSVAQHGPSNGLTGGGNTKLDAAVEALLNAPSDAPELAAYQQAIQQANRAEMAAPLSAVADASEDAGENPKPQETDQIATANQPVSGVKMEVSHHTEQSASEPPPRELWWWSGIISGAVILVVAGMLCRVGAR